jgi:hypothetical protein
VNDFYRYISKGKFFKSLEIIDAGVVFRSNKESYDYNP